MFSSKKVWWSIVGVLLIILVLLIIRIFSSEDVRICQNGQWVTHGHPSSSKPLTGCLVETTGEIKQESEIPFMITSVFSSGESIPSIYTCQGKNIQPSFNFEGIPERTKSLALIVDDPDAPNGIWTHRIVWNIPKTSVIEENKLPLGTVQGKNSWGTLPYRGPCPPSGTHRYYFTAYALDEFLDLSSGSSKQAFQNALEKHIIDTTYLMGIYKK